MNAKFSSLTIRTTVALSLLLGAAAVQARPPHTFGSTVTRTGPAGKTSTRQSSLTTNGQGGYSAGSTLTGPYGHTTTRSQSGAYDSATQSYNRSGTTTYPNGQQSSFNTSLQATSNGYTRSAARTGPNGQSITSQGQASYNPATGTINQSRTTTYPNGQTSTENRTIDVGSPQ